MRRGSERTRDSVSMDHLADPTDCGVPRGMMDTVLLLTAAGLLLAALVWSTR